MKELNDDFLDDIRKALRNHEEPYDGGAWERFAAKHQPKARRVVPIWKWATAAATLAGIVFSVLYFMNPSKTLNTENSVAVNVKKDSEINKLNKGQVQIIATDSTDGHTEHIYPQNIGHDAKNIAPVLVASAQPLAKNTVAPQIIDTTGKQAAETVKASGKKSDNFWENKIITDTEADKNQVAANNNRNTPASLTREKIKLANTDLDKKWHSSLYVSPTYSDLGMSMGYGYSIGFAINSKIKISTGIAYSQMTTARSFDAPNNPNPGFTANGDGVIGATSSLATAKEFRGIATAPFLSRIEGTVAGIDVPLDIGYSISKKFYASAGVSGLFVLNSQYNSTYINNQNERIVVKNEDVIVENKTLSFSTYANVNTVSTPSSTSMDNSKATHLLGFYNVSMGYRQNVSKSNALSLEPFIKIPMSSVSDQKLNYLGMGLKLKFDF